MSWWDELDTDRSKDQQKAARLVNVLGSRDREQKLKWLTRLMPQLQATAGQQFDPETQPRQFGNKMVELTCRYWRARVRQKKCGTRRGSFEMPQQAGKREKELTRMADVLELRK